MKYIKRITAVLFGMGILLLPATAQAVSFDQGGNSFGTDATLGTNDAYSLIFETDGTERLRVDEAGNIGINTDSPAALVHIKDGEFLFESSYDFMLKAPNGESGPGNIRYLDHNGNPVMVMEYGMGTYPGFIAALDTGDGIYISDTNGNVAIGRATSNPVPEGDLQVTSDNANSTLYVGASENSNMGQMPGCFVLGDSDGVGVTYITADDGVLSATDTKPGICD